MAFNGYTRATPDINWLCPVNWVHSLNDGVRFWQSPAAYGRFPLKDLLQPTLHPSFAFSGSATTANLSSHVIRSGSQLLRWANTAGGSEFSVKWNYAPIGVDEPFSMSFWYSPGDDVGAVNPQLAGLGSDSGSWNVQFNHLDSTKAIQFQIVTTSPLAGYSVDSVRTIANNSDPVFIEGVWGGPNDENIYIYLDGVFQASASTGAGNRRTSTPDDVFLFAGFADSGTTSRNGSVGDLRLRVTGRNDQASRQLYLQALGLYPSLFNRVPQRYYSMAAALGSHWMLAPRTSSPTISTPAIWELNDWNN